MLARITELQTHEHRQGATNDRHEHGKGQVLLADHLVIEAENVLAYEALLAMVVVVMTFAHASFLLYEDSKQ